MGVIRIIGTERKKVGELPEEIEAQCQQSGQEEVLTNYLNKISICDDLTIKRLISSFTALVQLIN